MNFTKIYNAVAAEFDADIALYVVQICSINILLKPKLSELSGKKSFEDRIIKKAKALLWEADENQVETALEIWRVSYDWSVRQSLNGIGGCTQKTFKQLLGGKNEIGVDLL